MNISEVAKITGLTAKSIRLYEDKQLISPPTRGGNGYRQYTSLNVDELAVIASARKVGFSLDECRDLVQLAFSETRMSADVKVKANQKLIEIRAKIEELQQIERQLSNWVGRCPGNTDHTCPIINGLKGEE